MRILKQLAALAAAILTLAFASATPASAQGSTRTWVSGTGDDANTCSRTAPCLTFAGAFPKTANNGQITCLDPGGFGTINITKSITIDCTGTQGSILAAGTTGITINGNLAEVVLRNLQIEGAHNVFGNGIRILNARSVVIDNVTVLNSGGTGTNGRGISIETAADNVSVVVVNSRIIHANNFGIQSQPTAGNVVLNLRNTEIARGNNSAIALINATTASISNCLLAQNTGAGVSLQNANVTAQISNCDISFNGFGIANGLGGASTVRLYGNSITGNTVGVRIDAGSVFTYGNNGIRGNTGNETPTAPSLGTQ
ncbi:MAG TPA: right-handed parallel beta-helix repeat-containing protein [Allosphingosinicella sp.]